MRMRHEHKKTYYNDIGLRLAEKLLGLQHLHYGYFSEGLPKELSSLSRAQEAYAEHLMGAIPGGVKRVLDVGCGTGGIAKALVERDYRVTCLAPDPYLIQKTLENTQQKVTAVTELYENFHDMAPGSFDLVLMSESCQYVKVREGWEQNRKYLRDGGFVLVSDFFKVKDVDLSHVSKSGHVLSTYLESAEEAGFELLKQEEITDQVVPTMDIYQALILDKVFPVVEAVIEFLQRRYPKVYTVLQWRLKKKALKLKTKYENQGSDIFKKYKKYVVLLFKKRRL